MILFANFGRNEHEIVMCHHLIESNILLHSRYSVLKIKIIIIILKIYLLFSNQNIFISLSVRFS